MTDTAPDPYEPTARAIWPDDDHEPVVPQVEHATVERILHAGRTLVVYRARIPSVRLQRDRLVWFVDLFRPGDDLEADRPAYVIVQDDEGAGVRDRAVNLARFYAEADVRYAQTPQGQEVRMTADTAPAPYEPVRRRVWPYADTITPQVDDSTLERHEYRDYRIVIYRATFVSGQHVKRSLWCADTFRPGATEPTYTRAEFTRDAAIGFAKCDVNADIAL